MTRDYKRNGMTSLDAALEIATGEITVACYPQHRHQEFLASLNQIVRAYPRRPLHVVLDNSSMHSTPEVTRWHRVKSVHFHFTPTSRLSQATTSVPSRSSGPRPPTPSWRGHQTTSYFRNTPEKMIYLDHATLGPG